jgi:hypothetical protein
MFVVTEAEAATIRAAFEQHGEFAAAIELRRLFPSVTDTAQAQECARTIVAWMPLPVKPRLGGLPGKQWPVVPTRTSASKPPPCSSHSARIMPTHQQLGDATGRGSSRRRIRRLLLIDDAISGHSVAHAGLRSRRPA